MDIRWDPRLYRHYSGERQRPFYDLLAQIPGTPGQIVDLGCGDGRLTRRMRDRWPDAAIVGVDDSAEMIADAPSHVPGLRFEQADLRDWRPQTPPDLIVSNAALHWVADHEALLERLIGLLGPHGTLAVQVPLNHDAPSHRAVRAVAAQPEWSDRFRGLGAIHVLPPDAYLGHLRSLGCHVDLWTTTYHHLLPAPDGVIDWVRGTTLRPYLSRLAPDEEGRFLDAVAKRLEAAYPPDEGRIHYPFRRLFFVARKGI